MTIAGVTHVSPCHASSARPKHTHSADEPKGKKPHPHEGRGPRCGKARAHGVLRLLQAGHFKGVADVRLRINFHEQLSAAQAEATRGAGEQAAHQLSDAVNTALDALAATEGLDEQQVTAIGDLRDEFNAAVGQAINDFLQADAGGQALTGGLQSAFDALVDGLGIILPAPAGEQIAEPLPPETEPPAEPVVEAQLKPVVEPAPDAEAKPKTPDPLAALHEAFRGGMDALNDALTNTSILPPLSPAPGHGRAYAKFLAIYERLHAPPPPPPPPAAPEGDAEAPNDAPPIDAVDVEA